MKLFNHILSFGLVHALLLNSLLSMEMEQNSSDKFTSKEHSQVIRFPNDLAAAIITIEQIIDNYLANLQNKPEEQIFTISCNVNRFSQRYKTRQIKAYNALPEIYNKAVTEKINEVMDRALTLLTDDVLDHDGREENLSQSRNHFVTECFHVIMDKFIALDSSHQTPFYYAQIKDLLGRLACHYKPNGVHDSQFLNRIQKKACQNIGHSKNFPSLLHLACTFEDIEWIRDNIDRCVNDVNSFNHHQETPLIIAAKKQNYEISNQLLAYGANPNYAASIAPLAYTVQNKNIQLTKLLLQYEADRNGIPTHRTDEIPTIPPLFHAVRNNDLEMVRLLVGNSSDNKYYTQLSLGYSGQSFITYAEKKGYQEIASLLTEYEQNNTVLPRVLSLDLNNNNRISNNIHTNIHFAARTENLAWLKRQLTKSQGIGIFGYIKRILNIPLPEANMLDNHRYTPLMHAIKSQKTMATQLLLKHGADVNNAGGTTNSPLVIAVNKNNLDLATELLHHGANPNYSDSLALLLAVRNNNLAITKLLLGYNANTKIKVNEKSLEQYARDKGYDDIANELKQHNQQLTQCENKALLIMHNTV